MANCSKFYEEEKNKFAHLFEVLSFFIVQYLYSIDLANIWILLVIILTN